MDAFLRDLRLAVRTLAATPARTGVLLLTGALAIGAATALFDLWNVVLWRPLPGTAGPELVRVYLRSPQPFIAEFGNHPRGDLEEYTRSSRTFAALAGDVGGGAVLEDGGAGTSAVLGTRALEARYVTGNYWSVLGLRPARGRLHVDADDSLATTATAVVSWRLYEEYQALRSVGGGGDLVGRAVQINGQPVQVIGVAPESFRGGVSGLITDIWLPMSWGTELVASFDAQPDRQSTDILGRLEAGATPAAAEEELQRIAQELDRTHPLPNMEREITVTAGSMTHPLDQRGFRPILRSLAAAVILLLVLASANIAALLLAHGVERSGELAVRSALGATVGQIVRRGLTESVLLAAACATLGFGVAVACRRVLSLFDLETFALEMRFDHRVLLATALTTLVTAVTFGLGPSLSAGRTPRISSLREGSQTASRSKLRVFRALAGVQIALGTALLVCTGVLLTDLWRLRNAPLGFDQRGLVRAFVDLRAWDYSDQEAQTFLRELASEVRARPEVRAASHAFLLPPVLLDLLLPFELPGEEEPRNARFNFVDGEYFPTLGLETLRGRVFDARDIDGPSVAIVNRDLAETLWPGEDPVGKTLVVRRTTAEGRSPEHLVIGEVASLSQHELGAGTEPVLYLPVDQRPRQISAVVARGDLPPAQLKAIFEEEARALDPRVVPTLRSAAEHRWDALVVQRLQSQSAGLLAAIGLLLAAAGTFAAMSVVVAQRRREIGVRKALGSTDAGAALWITNQALRVCAIGATAGLGMGVLGVRALRAYVLEVGPATPGLGAAVFGGMLLIAAAASLGAALRAARIEPIRALRS